MNRFVILLMTSVLLSGSRVWAQEKPEAWDLKSCVAYAFYHNIKIKRSKVALAQSQESTLQVRAQLFPSLSFSSGHNLVNRPENTDSDKNNYSGNYGMSSSVLLYNGGKLVKNIRQQELRDEIAKLSVSEAQNNIELSITETFLQILYAGETVKINENTLNISEKQRNRSKELLNAGSISQSNYAQMEAQYSTDKYQLIVARSTLDEMKLQLKQLLELDIMEEMQLIVPELTDEKVMQVIPGKQQVYEMALEIMPEIKSSRLNIDVAGLDKAKAQAGYLPSLNLSAGIGTSHISGSDYSFFRQVKNSFNESVGLTLSIPIYSNRENRSAVRIAGLQIDESLLNYQSTQKDLLKTIESVCLDAVSSQNRFKAANESLKAIEQSYRLIEEQFYLGMKNTLDLLTEKNNLLSAQQEVLQAKYMTILNLQLLNFYQGKQIQL